MRLHRPLTAPPERSNAAANASFISSVPLFAALSEDKLDEISCALKRVEFREVRKEIRSRGTPVPIGRPPLDCMPCDDRSRRPANKALHRAALGTTHVHHFPQGETLMRQGEPNESFYVIESGEVSVQESKAGGEDCELLTRRRGEYLGEMSLLSDNLCSATVRATSRVSCQTLDRASFHELLGPLKELLEHCFCMRVLERVDIFSGLSQEDLAEVADALTVRRSVGANRPPIAVRLGTIP